MAKKKHKIKKGELEVDEDNNFKLSMEIEDAEDVPGNQGPNAADIKDEIRIVQTNPCTWINVGGNWRRICW
jgi:hypothetical protein